MQIGDKNDLLIVNGKINKQLFVISIQVSCIKGEIMWARYFSVKYLDSLDTNPLEQKQISKLTEGHLLLREGKYHRGIVVVDEVRVNDYKYFYKKNILLLQLNYEAYVEDAFGHVDDIVDGFSTSINRYLRKSEIKKSFHLKRKNFLVVYKLIINYHKKTRRTISK